MSVVTNIILTTGPEEEDEAIEHINGLGGYDFSELGPTGNYAGTKFLECGVYIGAFNHLDLKAMVDRINRAPWQAPQKVQLFVQEQNDDRFKEMDLFP